MKIKIEIEMPTPECHLPTPPPTPESPCKKKISKALKDLYEFDPKGRRSLAEIFELVDYERLLKRKQRMSMGKINKK